MKRYEFHSALPPEEVFARLSVRARESRWLDPWIGKELFLYCRKEERFWLTCTGTMPITGFIPFSATVRAEGTGSVISGGFSVWRAIWKHLAIGSVIVFFAALLFGAPLWMAALAAVLAFFWFSLTQEMTQKAFWKRRQAVLAFIEDNLLN